MLVGVLVGDPIGFTVLKHVYHFKTEIFFKHLQNNFYTKSLIVRYSGLRFRTEWNGPFHSGRNGLTHFIPARMV